MKKRDKKDKKIIDLEERRIDKRIEEEADEECTDQLKDMVRRFTQDTLTGK